MGRRFAPENPYALETSARVAFHRGRCRDAIEDQQQAVAKLPKEWPDEERARFKQALATYQRECSSGATPAAPSNG
ncbi:TPR domain protein [Myxococcus hansupus]|uniref:TPR domain protein n=1 Tax=Pseudomyxococcus hansupus TaxID=1297742 RepID=A0A0H4WZ61_9BACT|nr:TPR domain protein [Myxococcus hansupus]